MPNDWDMASMMSPLYISGQGSERARDGKRKYHLPELKILGAKIVTVYLCLNKFGRWTKREEVF